jgi:ribose 5-phosphate isomerase A
MSLSDADLAKRAAAARALELVEPGMRLGLGSGSTAAWFVRLLAERIAGGLDVRSVATSSGTTRLAAELGVPLEPLEALGRIDLTVDGADEFDPDLTLIKGGGAALLQEKIVASASARLVIVTDVAKRVAKLGAFPLPVEVVRFGWPVTRAAIEALLTTADVDGRRVSLREADGAPLVTDEGHYVLDLHLGRIGDPSALAAGLVAIPGVVEHGLFVGMAERVLIGHPDGQVEEELPVAADFALESMRGVDA